MREICIVTRNSYNVNGVVGHECVNEIIVDRLLTVLGIEHLDYTLINADVIQQRRIYHYYHIRM